MTTPNRSFLSDYDCSGSADAGRCSIVRRGLGWGSLLGALAGGVAGTALWPIVGTFIGSVVGLPVGAAFGLIGGAVLALVDVEEATRVRLVLTNAATSGGCAALLSAALHVTAIVGLLFASVSAVIGAAIGPRVALGGRAAAGRSTHRGAASTPADDGVLAWSGRGAAAGLGTGAAVGAVLGAVGGFPATAPAAVVEGAFLGVPVGLLAGAAVGVVGVAVRALVRR